MTIFFPHKEVDYLMGRLFQISLTGGRALIILFYYSIKRKIRGYKKEKMARGVGVGDYFNISV